MKSGINSIVTLVNGVMSNRRWRTAIVIFSFLMTLSFGVISSVPTRAQSLGQLADSWNGVHSWLSLRINGNYTDSYLASIAFRYDFASSYHNAVMAAANPQLVSAAYRTATQDNFNHGLTWYQANHPDWMLYTCSRQPILAYGNDGPAPDFTNPAVVDYQWSAMAPNGPNLLLDNTWLDNDYPNFSLGNYYQACGVYASPGQWVQKFAGIGSYATVPDPNFTQGMITYLGQLTSRLHARQSPTGPGLLFVNSDPKVVASNSALTTGLLNSIDGIQTEGGQYGWEYPGDLWLNNIKFAERADDLNKGVYQQLCPVASSEATINPAYVRYALAAYLLAKGHHTALKMNPDSDCGYYQYSSNIYWPQEFETTHKGSGVPGATGIGTPCARQSLAAGPNPAIYGVGVYMREYSGGVALVNTSLAGGVTLGAAYTAVLPPGSTYRDIYGNPIGSSATVQPMSGMILLKTSNPVCSNGVVSSPTPPPAAPPAVSAISVTNITSSSATINWTTDKSADGQVEFINPCPTGGCFTPVASGFVTSHSINVSGLAANTFYSYRIRTSDAASNLTITANQNFTSGSAPAAPAPPPPTGGTGGSGGTGTLTGEISAWNDLTRPAVGNEMDPLPVEVGVKFKSDVSGPITAIRFYKGFLNNGTHTVSLWSSAGALLGRAVSSNETSQGWQTVRFATPVTIAANTTYVASYHTTSGNYSITEPYFTSQYNNGPLHMLADGSSGGNGVYRYTGSPAFPNSSYMASNYWVDVVLGTTGAATSLWNSNAVPASPNATDPSPVEVGVKFRSDVNGTISAIRFFKGSRNTGTHTVSLWSTNGTLLARAVSSNESASGWQQVNLTSPVAITANTTYIASYHTTSGFYAITQSYFASPYDNAPLHAPADAASGGNGVYRYTSTPGFPGNTWSGSNYWVDVVLGP